MSDYSFPSLTTVQSSGLSTGFQTATTAAFTLYPTFQYSELEPDNFILVGLTAQVRGWNPPGRPQTGQLYPRGVYNK